MLSTCCRASRSTILQSLKYPNTRNPPLGRTWLGLQTAVHSTTRRFASERVLYDVNSAFYSTTSHHGGPQHEEEVKVEKAHKRKRKQHRAAVGDRSLRKVAVEAQRSRDGNEPGRNAGLGSLQDLKTITAIAAADQYDIAKASHILQSQGYRLDPYGTNLYPQVIHLETTSSSPGPGTRSTFDDVGDIFIFPSGTIVTWNIDDDMLSTLVNTTMRPAAEGNEQSKTEQEDLDYIVDSQRENSGIRNDSIVLGTKAPPTDAKDSTRTDGRDLNTVLAKIAFSSGLARSAKLSVLETLLEQYFDSTKEITQRLSRGGRLPSSRSAILQKTGQLLNIRAKLNLYSELTDSLPDLFWDSKQELGLEGYFDQVGRVLDTNVRIKTLNQRMDYAQEIASVLRQQLSENHSIRLEWIIIILIMIEVGFNIWQEVKEKRREKKG